MSTFLDDIFGPITQDLMSQLGKAVVYVRPTLGAYNATTGQVATGTTATLNIKATVETPGPRDFPGIGIASGDRILSIAGADLTAAPAPGETFTFDGATYTIPEGGVEAIYSGEDVALYRVLARLT